MNDRMDINKPKEQAERGHPLFVDYLRERP